MTRKGMNLIHLVWVMLLRYLVIIETLSFIPKSNRSCDKYGSFQNPNR